VIVAPPGLSAVTRPLAEMLAVVGSLEPHVTRRPVSTPPMESNVAAVSCAVALTMSVSCDG
jgi:hypothetical protein